MASAAGKTPMTEGMQIIWRGFEVMLWIWMLFCGRQYEMRSSPQMHVHIPYFKLQVNADTYIVNTAVFESL